MDAIDCLHLQLRLEGKEVINGNLLRQVEVVPNEEMPLAVVAALATDEFALYCDEMLLPAVRDEMNSEIHLLRFPNVKPLIDILQTHNFNVEVGHYKTYVFPDRYRDAGTEEVKLYHRSDPRIQAFGFEGFTERVHAIERDGKIVSACVSAKENEHCGEAWVFTDRNHRHQGLAKDVVSIWARDLLRAGKVPFYSHKINNSASASLAKYLGLKHVFDEITISRAELS